MRSLSRFFKDIFKPVSVFVIPHNGMNSVRFNPPMFLLILGGFIWTGVTIWSGFVVGKYFDYNITKTDNKVLREKMLKISSQVDDGLSYLAMTKKTDMQIRKVLGMNNGEEPLEEGIGGPDQADMEAFRRQLTARAAEIRETELVNAVSNIKDESKRRLASYGEITIYLTDKHNGVRATPSIWPTQGRITSQFGYRVHPLGLTSFRHSGVDIANSAGTPVNATADGVVRHAGWAQGYGMCIVLDHGFGYSTLYGHMSEIIASKTGRRVKRGETIGHMGSTGTSTGNHLHYEVWIGGIPRNPVPYLKKADSQDVNFSGLYDGIFSVL